MLNVFSSATERKGKGRAALLLTPLAIIQEDHSHFMQMFNQSLKTVSKRQFGAAFFIYSGNAVKTHMKARGAH